MDLFEAARKAREEDEFEGHPYAGDVGKVDGSDTSRDAGESIKPNAGTMRRRVWEFLRAYGPHTDEEMEDALGIRHQSLSARRRELVLKGLVKDTGDRRPTSSGRTATVWRAVELEEAHG